MLPTRPASEQILRSVVEHAFRFMVRNLDQVHLKARVIGLIHWLPEPTRARLGMDDDVAAEAMLQ